MKEEEEEEEEEKEGVGLGHGLGWSQPAMVEVRRRDGAPTPERDSERDKERKREGWMVGGHGRAWQRLGDVEVVVESSARALGWSWWLEVVG